MCSKTNITDYEEAIKAVHTSPVKDSDRADVNEDGDDDEEPTEDDTAEPLENKQEL